MDISQFVKSYNKVDRPVSLTIELTDMCNFKCIHCYHGERKNTFLDKDAVIDTIRQFKDLGLCEVTITGGEPLIHPDFLELLIEINNQRVFINLFTNASLLTKEIIEVLCDVNVKDVQFSLYGLDFDTFSQTTGTSSQELFSNYLSGINLLSQSSLNVTCAMVIMNGNFNQRKQMLEFCLKNKFNMRSSYRLISTRTSTDKNKYDLSFEEKKLLMSEIVEYNKKKKETAKLHSTENEPQQVSIRNGMCTAGKTSFCLTASGEILPCPGYYYSLGSIFELKIKDILSSPKALIIRNTKRSDYLRCNECAYFNYCAFCPGIIFNEGLSIDFHDCSICQESKIFSTLINQ